jgi:hypothetical protein
VKATEIDPHNLIAWSNKESALSFTETSNSSTANYNGDNKSHSSIANYSADTKLDSSTSPIIAVLALFPFIFLIISSLIIICMVLDIFSFNMECSNSLHRILDKFNSNFFIPYLGGLISFLISKFHLTKEGYVIPGENWYAFILLISMVAVMLLFFRTIIIG